MIIEADGKYGHLRKRDVKRDIFLSKDQGIQYILHIRVYSKKDICKQILAGLEKVK